MTESGKTESNKRVCKKCKQCSPNYNWCHPEICCFEIFEIKNIPYLVIRDKNNSSYATVYKFPYITDSNRAHYMCKDKIKNIIDIPQAAEQMRIKRHKRIKMREDLYFNILSKLKADLPEELLCAVAKFI